MKNNKLMIAAAGSGKTTYLVNKALQVKDKNVLITTYTEANEAEIRKKIIKETGGHVPNNITVQTWFSFLLQHGVRPYQSVMNDKLHGKKIGFILTDRQSGFKYQYKGKPIYWGKSDFFKYYFTKDFKIYSDKISDFIFECNKRSKGLVIGRISKIYPFIFIDEIQDLAGWELEILKLLFDSPSEVLLVGDPRQVTYLTHHSRKHGKFKDGKIKEFIENECKKNICTIDETTLQKSHRNNQWICEFSSKLYPEYAVCKPCECKKCRNDDKNHQGVFLVKEKDVDKYCEEYSPTILKYQKAVYPDWNYGKSKGLGFDRILIYPTEKIRNYLVNGKVSEINTIKAKIYVALTRAKYSVGIIFNYSNKDYVDGIEKYVPGE